MDIMNLAFMGYYLTTSCLPPIICTPDIFFSRQCVADMGSFVLGPNCRMSQGSSPSGGVALTTSIMLWAPWLPAVVVAGTTQLKGLDLSFPLTQWNSHALSHFFKRKKLCMCASLHVPRKENHCVAQMACTKGLGLYFAW